MPDLLVVVSVLMGDMIVHHKQAPMQQRKSKTARASRRLTRRSTRTPTGGHSARRRSPV